MGFHLGSLAYGSRARLRGERGDDFAYERQAGAREGGSDASQLLEELGGYWRRSGTANDCGRPLNYCSPRRELPLPPHHICAASAKRLHSTFALPEAELKRKTKMQQLLKTKDTSTRIIKRRFFGRYFCRFVEKPAFYYPGKITFLATFFIKRFTKN